jgi:uncharacterized protein YbaP (TraB family)
MRTLAIIAVLAAFACNTTRKQAVKPRTDALLWRITGKGSNPSYLYGTMHIVCSEDMSIGDSLKSAMDRSGKLYLELDMDDPMMMMKTAQLSMLKEGSIKELAGQERFERIEKFMKDSIGLPSTLFNRMKPFALMSLMYTKIPACGRTESYEQRLMDMAKKGKKEVVGLETVEEQFGIFDRIPDTTELRMVMDMIDDFGTQRRQFSEMSQLYRKRDLDGLGAMIQSSPDMAGMEDVMLWDRNKRWIPTMEKAMSSSPVLFAVGAGHLPGEEGVIRLLRKAGYRVEPVE